MAEYIDRNLLKERFRKRLQWLKLDVHNEYSDALLDGCETDFDLIDDIPVANNVKEIVYAHWIYKPDCGVTVCSACHRSVEEYVDYPCCMFCGAEMSESVE